MERRHKRDDFSCRGMLAASLIRNRLVFAIDINIRVKLRLVLVPRMALPLQHFAYGRLMAIQCDKRLLFAFLEAG